MNSTTPTTFKLVQVFLVFFYIQFTYGQNATSVNVSGSSATNSITNNVATVVDPNLVITANGNLTHFTVSITDSYTSGDVLGYTGSLPSGITADAWSAAKRSLVFRGTTTAANWQALLRTVTLTTTSAVCNPESRKVTFVVGEKYFNPLNSHFYTYNAPTGSSYWLTAVSGANTDSYFGRIGYLVTLTSASENSFVSVLIGNDAWIGLSDDYSQINAAVGYTLYANQTASEGKFYWVTGPERGTYVTNGNGTPVTQSGQYANWNGGEPNNAGSEHYGELYVSQKNWNDLPNAYNMGSIYEWGGMPNDNTTSQVYATRNILINGAPSGTITGGNVTVCPTTNSTTLTLSGLSGTVAKWQYSLDNFLTTGVDITNTSTSYTVTNISQTTYYRAIVNSSSGCSNLATSPTPIYVSSTIAGNIVADNNTICPNGTVTFNLYGNSGSVTKWQQSTSSNFSTGVTDISNTSTTLSSTLSSAGTYYFRAVVQNGSCTAANTSGYTITVSSGTPPVGGTIANAEHCGPGTFSGTLTLSGSTGTVSKWQYSTDGGVVWTDVANTTTSLSYSGVSANRLYRAVLTNGSCGTANSSNAQIFIYGTTVTKWLGTYSNDWSDPTNWCGGVANNGIDVVISSSALDNLTLDQNRTVGTITFNGANKVIRLGPNTLTSSTIFNADANNRIKTNLTGSLKISVGNNISAFFPVGNSTYDPLTITNKTGTSDVFGVNVVDLVYINGTSGSSPTSTRVDRTWNISKTNANGGNGVDFIFQWNDPEEVGTMNDPNLNHHNGTNWHLANYSSKSSTSTSLNLTGYTGTFSPFSIANGTSALPSELIYFNVECENGKNALSWATASESNTDKFIIEKSEDGFKWNAIDELKAAGNSNVEMDYEYQDLNAKRIVNYYQIKQLDFDGYTTLYGPITSNCQNIEEEVSVYPNPTKENFQINFHSKENENFTLSIENNEGKTIITKNLMVKSGNNVFPIDTSSLSSGVYILKLTNQEKMIIKKIVLLEK